MKPPARTPAPAPMQAPAHVLKALGLTPEQVFHVRMDGDEWVIVTKDARKFREPDTPPPPDADALDKIARAIGKWEEEHEPTGEQPPPIETRASAVTTLHPRNRKKKVNP